MAYTKGLPPPRCENNFKALQS